eukprot:scaffold48870_cov270-Isochrysis_galbana.AAC.6
MCPAFAPGPAPPWHPSSRPAPQPHAHHTHAHPCTVHFSRPSCAPPKVRPPTPPRPSAPLPLAVFSRPPFLPRQVRLFHMLYWSVQVKPAKGDYYTSSLSLLLSDAAVAGLLRRGALTQSEADCLANPELPATQRHSAVIEWIMVRIISARREGVVLGDAGFEQVFLDKACLLRAVCATLPDDRDARMPLAYVHFVQ